MSKLFTQTANHRIDKAICSDFFKTLPDAILKHSGWDYAYQQTDSGCLLKPTFRNMPYRNSFVPEIDISVSSSDEYAILQMRGQPVKFVRNFMTIWFSALSMFEAFFLVLAITSNLDRIFPVFIPVGMCAFGYLLCKIATKATFTSVVKAIKKEYP